MFPGIADRMSKEITSLAPSSMKIKVGGSWFACVLAWLFFWLLAAVCPLQLRAYLPPRPCSLPSSQACRPQPGRPCLLLPPANPGVGTLNAER